ncbi:MAG TPA: glutamyl-tRNA reductase [Acidiferrobacteraceae bacterium]|nr:glutamyl-tRNA reductase [Acidiferrobacteraceae bacterium]
MQVLSLGINHETAPVEVREKAAFAAEDLACALQDIRSHKAVTEVTILSTCNRTELYCSLEHEDWKRVLNWFCAYHQLKDSDIEPYIYRHGGIDAVKHTFRVASGLDSMVLGEPQILGQLKQAFATAHQAGATGKILNRLFQHSFAVAKQVRTDTSIGASAVSVAFAAVNLAHQIFSSLKEQTVLLIGAGDTIELTARHLNEQGVGKMIVANRTVERAESLARGFKAEAIPLSELPERLSDADIVISSTASQLPILGKGAMERALKIRKHRPMFLVDLAVPRDIEPEVRQLNDAYLYTVDDLRGVVEENRKSRREAAVEAEKIIDIQGDDFMRWLQSLEGVPTIRALRDSSNALREVELERARQMLARGDDPEKVITELARALTNKLTHGPSAALNEASKNSNQQLLDAARRLFNLSDDSLD